MAIKKRLLKGIFLLSLSGFTVTSLSISLTSNSHKETFKITNNLQDVATKLDATNGSYTATTNPTPTNKYANEITNQELKSVLVAPQDVKSFTVVILPVTEKNINEGNVDFLVYEQNNGGSYSTTFANAGDKQSENYKNGSEKTLSVYKDSSNNSAKFENVFNTSKFNELNSWLKKKQLSIKWKTNDEIESYIKNKTTEGLTEQDVYMNLLDTSSMPPLKASNAGNDSQPYTEIKIENVTSYNNNQNDSFGEVGLYKITINLKNTNTAKQKDSTNTQVTESIKYLGGFLNNGKRDEIKLVGNTNISNISLKELEDNPNKTYFNSKDTIASPNTKLNELTPSEFVSPEGGKSKLIEVLTQNVGLNNDGNKILSLSYGTKTNIELNKQNGTSQIDDKKDITSEFKITNIDTIPNDSNGSLQLIIYYKVFDVFSGEVKDKITTFNFPENTFRVNPNVDGTLFVNWKTSEALPNMNYSYEVVNEYYKNKDNNEFLRIFSNQFLDTTDYVKNLPRKVEINYGVIPGTANSNGSFETSNDKTVKVTLTFENWGITGDSFTISHIFELKGYKYGESSGQENDSLTFQWKSSNEVLKENSTFSEIQPTSIALDLIAEGSGPNNTSMFSTFATGEAAKSLTEVTFEPNDSEGTMMVYFRKKNTNGESIIESKTHVYQQLFVGFKKVNTDKGVTSFAWIPQDMVDPKLLAIPLNQITKQDVFDLYLSKIDLFANRVLTDNDVQIKPEINANGESTLLVQVTIPTYDQSVPGINASKQTFVTRIKGFSSTTSVNDTVFNPPKDYTALISISSAISISVILGTILCGLLIKRGRIRSFEKHDEILGLDKKNKKQLINFSKKEKK